MRTWFAAGAVMLCAPAAGAEEVRLITGERLVAEIVARSETTLVLQHPVLGRLEVAMSSIAGIDGAASESPELSASDAEPVPGKERNAPLGISPTPPLPTKIDPPAASVPDEPPQWSKRLELGLNASEGTTQTANFRVAVTLQQEKAEHETLIDARYVLASDRGDRNENKFTTGAHAEWPTPVDRLHYFIEGRYDYDEFNSWDQRVTGGGGLSWRAIEIKQTIDEKVLDVFGLRLRAGGGVKQEWGSSTDELQPEGILGSNLKWHVDQRQTIVAGATYFPNFDDTGEYRLTFNAEWAAKLDWLNGLSLKIGVEDEYQSRTDGDVDHLDLSVYAALLLDF